MAVSNDSDALHGWSIFWMPVQGNFPNDWCDYPQIGLSSGGFVYLTCNMFSLPNAGGSATPMIRVMPESEFTGGGCCSWWEFWNLSGWSIQPTVMRNSATGNGEFLASSGNGSADQHHPPVPRHERDRLLWLGADVERGGHRGRGLQPAAMRGAARQH